MSDEMVTEREAVKWAMIAHLAGFAAFTSVPFANILGPLVVWLLKRDEHPFINDQGREAVNFQISMAIYFVVITVAMIVLMLVLVGFLLIPVLGLLGLAYVVLMIVAAVKANSGEWYRYPFIIRFLN